MEQKPTGTETRLQIPDKLTEALTARAMEWLGDRDSVADLMNAIGSLMSAAAEMWTANAANMSGDGPPMTKKNFLIMATGLYDLAAKQMSSAQN